MIYYINKLALLIANPITIGIVLLVVGLLARKNSRRWLISGIVWFSMWGMGATQRIMGYSFGMDKYRAQKVCEVPSADAIVDLGGGVWARTNVCVYPMISSAADRVVMSARLWKAKRAPVIVPSCVGCQFSDARLLSEFGVPESAIWIENQARNTEENAVFVQDLLLGKMGSGRKIKILLVTSVSHMPRALMIFNKKAPMLECIPIVADFGSVNFFTPWSIDDLIPSVGTFVGNMVVYKECLGVIGYKLRGF